MNEGELRRLGDGALEALLMRGNARAGEILDGRAAEDRRHEMMTQILEVEDEEGN